jgi:uncharacterized membrane protein SpoIIM required for sporulation
MLEMLLNPKKAERKPWELFFVGLFYTALSILLVNWLFTGNPIFSKYSSMLIITFVVMFSTPFIYYTIKLEEEKDIALREEKLLIKEHGKALASFVFLFLGFLIAFFLFYILQPSTASINFAAQLEQFCSINMPQQVEQCIAQYDKLGGSSTAKVSATQVHALEIFTNNIFVLIFTIIFSLAFSSGAIFILAWNASVIAIAMAIFSKASLSALPAALLRYMIHGLPEITAYFTAALAGGIISIAVIRHDFKQERFWHIMQDSLDLILLSIILLIIAALIEVFITPIF